MDGNWPKIKKNIFFKIGIGIIIFLLFVLLMDKVVMPFYVQLGDEIELPDVTEMTVEIASSEMESKGFSVVIADSVFDPNLQKGTIVEQNPYPFTRVKKGRNVYLVVSIGKKPIIMPNLFYKSPRDAELILRSYGLKLRSTNYEYNDMAVEGVVIGQSFPQGQKVRRDTPINITVSLGPFPTIKTIPELIGKSLSAAKKQLRALGIKDIQVEYEERENMLPETVLKQDLKPGALVEEETVIKLLVSKLVPLETDSEQ